LKIIKISIDIDTTVCNTIVTEPSNDLATKAPSAQENEMNNFNNDLHSFSKAQAVIVAAKRNYNVTKDHSVLIRALRSLDYFKSVMENFFDMNPIDFNNIVGIDAQYLDLATQRDDCGFLHTVFDENRI
jgi:hypothetical protein